MLSLVAVAVFLAIWELIVRVGVVNRAILPSPMDVAYVAAAEFRKGMLLSHIAVSFGRIISGFAIGATIGIIVGVAIGFSRSIRSVMYPLVEILRPIPPLAWIPLAIIWFGIDEGSKVFLLTVTAFFPVVVNTYKGVGNIDPTLFQAARSLEMKGPALMLKIAIPGAMPDITTGLRISWSLVFAVLVAAEMIAAKSGMGFLIIDAMNLGRFDVVVFGIVLIGLLSVITDYIWQLVIARKLLHWHRGIDAVEE